MVQPATRPDVLEVTYAFPETLASKSSTFVSRNGLIAYPALTLYTAAASFRPGISLAIASNAESIDLVSAASAAIPTAWPPALLISATVS